MASLLYGNVIVMKQHFNSFHSLQLIYGHTLPVGEKSVLKFLLKFSFSTELNKNPVGGFSAGLIDDNDLYRWEVLIIGPPDTLQ